jgi:transcriptional regulator with PAS, ATPase and Fis domain
LFGHEKGAFTGAITRRQGSFELADRGTVFLDEVAEMSPATQAKLLRVLQERVVHPVGSERQRPIDVRIIAATNVAPLEAVQAGRLREDLYYRLNVFAVQLPPLRDRLDDLPLLAQAFVTEFSRELGKSVAGVSDKALAVLRDHRWPGNVRELRNVMERATIVTRSNMLEPADLAGFGTNLTGQPVPQAPSSASSVNSTSSTSSASSASSPVLEPGMTVADAERRLIDITLAHTGGNKTKAAAMLGISLKTLHNKLVREAARLADS